MRNTSRTWKKIHSSEFFHRLLLASIVTSLYLCFYLDNVMHNGHAYDNLST
jgi:hypothetical protein